MPNRSLTEYSVISLPLFLFNVVNYCWHCSFNKHAMPRQIPVPNINKAFIQASLSYGHRLDGRRPLDRRPLHISFPDPVETGVAGLGRCKVSLGKTQVLATVSAKLTEPRGDRPFEGMVSISSEIGPLAGEGFHGEGRFVCDRY